MENVAKPKETYKSVAYVAFLVTLFVSQIFLIEPSINNYAEWSLSDKIVSQLVRISVIGLLFVICYYREDLKMFSNKGFNFLFLITYLAIGTYFFISFYFYGAMIPLTILVFVVASLIFYFIAKAKENYE